ncbi:MAG: glycerol-3-phosphate 1-O-acyltransferase PlsY [Pseudomonadota bacterium]
MLFVIMCVLSYLFGSIPFGFIYGRFFYQQDIRAQGSGNIGATNAFRLGGSRLGALTLFSDMAKGMLAIYIAEFFGVLSCDMYYVAALAIAGHIFPVWLQFKGGKGIAVAFSVIFMLAPFCAINLALIWVGIFWQYRISSLASVLASLSFVILALIYDVWFPFAFIVSGMLLYAHRDNIEALIQGKEAPVA